MRKINFKFSKLYEIVTKSSANSCISSHLTYAYFSNNSVSFPKKIMNNRGEIILPYGTPFSILKNV